MTARIYFVKFPDGTRTWYTSYADVLVAYEAWKRNPKSLTHPGCVLVMSTNVDREDLG